MAGVGSWHGDAIRNITGSWSQNRTGESWEQGGSGALRLIMTGGIQNRLANLGGRGTGGSYTQLDASLVVPTAAENRPRSFGVLGCVYVGA